MIFCHGPEWTEIRNFSRNALRNYGYGNRKWMNDLMLNEMAEFVQYMTDESNSTGDGRVHFNSDYFHRSFLNITLTLVIGKRFNYNDPRLLKLLQYEHLFMKNGILGAGLMTAFPFLRYIFPKALGYDDQIGGLRGHHAIAKVMFLFKTITSWYYSTNILAYRLPAAGRVR